MGGASRNSRVFAATITARQSAALTAAARVRRGCHRRKAAAVAKNAPEISGKGDAP